nr:winged helix-turn-helix transcriptional regulator [Gammaproteobacteria bacterium]
MHTGSLARVASLLGDVTRASMLNVLMDGRALSAGELARVANITPQTASGHLAKLVDAGLLRVAAQGRHRYYAIASSDVAQTLEALSRLSDPPVSVTSPRTGPRDAELRAARSCYDHLAGRLAVSLADAMVERALLELDLEGGRLTERGRDCLQGLGVDLTPSRSRSPFCRPCLDWSERRPHVAGQVGRAMLTRFFELDWLRRRERGRCLRITPAGQLGFGQTFGVRVPDVVGGTCASR